MKTFKLNSERSNVVGQSGDFNSHSSMMIAEQGIHDIKALTQYAPILLSDDELEILATASQQVKDILISILSKE